MSDYPKILIVDDEHAGREILADLLLPQGYTFAFASSGAEALAKVPECAPDVILLDIMMPEIDGFEVCERLKADEAWQHVPIFLVTALDSKEDVIRGLDAGADDFLSKPVNRFELRSRVRSMLRIKKQFDELQATMQLRADLSHVIIHDMRTPLTSIILRTSYLYKTIDDPHLRKYLADIQKEAGHLKRFMEDMLVMAKMEHGKLTLDRDMVDLEDLVCTAQERFDVVGQSRGITLKVDWLDTPRHMSLDASLFQRVMDNLLSNAIKFSPPDSPVTLRISYPDDRGESYLCIQVLDEGPGVPESYRERIFDKYEVAPLKEAGITQTGLGLAFCRMVVEAHGGSIFVEANDPKGSIFTVRI